MCIVGVRSELFYNEYEDGKFKSRIGRFWYHFFRLAKRYASVIFTVNLILWITVTIMQSVYVYDTMELGEEVTYYLTVDLPVFDANNAINSATTTYSFNVVVSQATSSVSTSPEHRHLIPHGSLLSHEKKRLKSTYDTISLVYHFDDYDNLVTEDALVAACMTERNILNNVGCLFSSSYESIIAASLNYQTCEYLTSFNDVAPNFALSDNEYFVQDNPGSVNAPDSAILISYFQVGFCSSLSLDAFSDLLNAQGADYGISVVYVNSYLVGKGFGESVFNAIDLSVYAVLLCTLFFMLCIRGGVTVFVTLLCMFMATAQAAAMLPVWGYGSFSAFNIMSLFILLGVGVNSVILFGSAWRKHVAPGSVVATHSLMNIYHDIGIATLFTTVAAMLSLFSKLASPVVVISQLGAFMGIAVLVFYVLFHYLILPMWLCTGYFHLPADLHRQCDEWQDGVFGFVFGYRAAPLVLSVQDSEKEDRETRDSSLSDAFGDPEEEDQEQRLSGRLLPSSTSRAMSPASNFSDHKVRKIMDEHYYEPLLSDNERLESDAVDGTGNQQNGAPPPNDQAINSDTYELTNAVHRSNHDEVEPPELYQITAASSDNVRATSQNGWSAPLSRGIRYVKGIRGSIWLGLFALVLTLLALGGVYELVTQRLKVDFGIPQLFSPSSNLGQALYIVKNYKSSLLSVTSLDDIHIGSYTSAPSTSPAFRRPTMSPTVSSPSYTPTATPTNEPTLSQAPSSTFYSKSPSHASVSSRPTISPPPTSPSTTSYTVTGCWGISTSKKYKDSEVDLSFDVPAFRNYMHDTQYGLLSDMQSLCDYVESNRDYLNVNPDWDASTECIYQQYEATAQSDFMQSLPKADQTVSNTLLYWASQSITSGALLGVQKNTTAVPIPGLPYALDITFVCANFSVQSTVSNMLAHPDLAVTLNSRWQSAFEAHSSSSSASLSSLGKVEGSPSYNIPIISGSDEFTFPLLASEVLSSIILATIISVCGFVGLLGLFSFFDVSTMIFGTYTMLYVLAVAFCIHLYAFDATVDLLDIVVLIAVVGMVVDFPVHFLMAHLAHLRKKEREKANLIEEEGADVKLLKEFGEEEESKREISSGAKFAVVVQEGEQRSAGEVGKEKNVEMSTAAIQEVQLSEKRSWIKVESLESYMTFALFSPMVFTVLSGIPLLFADLQLVSKCGQYIIVIAATSFVTTTLLLPRIMKVKLCSTSGAYFGDYFNRIHTYLQCDKYINKSLIYCDCCGDHKIDRPRESLLNEAVQGEDEEVKADVEAHQ